MSIQYVGGQTAGRAGTTGTSTVTFALAGGMASVPAAGDLVVCTLVVGTLLARKPAMTISDYTSVGAITPSGTTYTANVNVLYKRMGSTPDTTIVMPSTGNAQDAQRWAIQVFRGVDDTTPLDVTPTSTTVTNTNSVIDCPNISLSVFRGRVILACGGAGTNTGLAYTTNGTSGFLSGFTADTADAVVAVSYSGAQSLESNPTAYGAGPADMTASAWGAFTLALRPARLRTFHIS